MILTIVMLSIAGVAALMVVVIAFTRPRPPMYVPPVGDPVADRIQPHPGPVDWEEQYVWVPAPHKGPGMYELREVPPWDA